MELHPLFIFGSSTADTPLGVVDALQLSDACLPKAGVDTSHRGTSHRLPASVASAWTIPWLALPGSSGAENRRAVHLGLPKILNEVLSVAAAEQFFSGRR